MQESNYNPKYLSNWSNMVENQEMQISSADEVKKRKYRESFCPEEFTHKFSSK